MKRLIDEPDDEYLIVAAALRRALRSAAACKTIYTPLAFAKKTRRCAS